MRAFSRGILGLAAAASLVTAGGCGSDIDDGGGAGGTSGGAGGTSGASGASGSGAVTGGNCVSTNPVCYGNREPSSVTSGAECMAALDNSPGGTLAQRVQWRQTWNRVISPSGSTSGQVYGILKNRATIREPSCFANEGQGGYMQISDWDRSKPLLEQTVTTGYASYSAGMAVNAPTPPTLGELATNGLCFIEWDYSFAGPATVTKEVTYGRWSDLRQPPLPQPWHVAPVRSKRVEADFEVTDAYRMGVPVGEGQIFINETTGYVHGYTPFSYVTILDNAFGGIAIPIRDVEVRSYFNDSKFNCVGRFRSDKMDESRGCDSGNDQISPPWGCKDDSEAACPPDPKMEKPPAALGGYAGPAYSTGYFLIVDLERVWSNSLGATLCVTNPGQTNAIDAGWANPSGWGLNCRGSSKWNPDLPNDEGLPMGDWCSKTNSKATETCHDAYQSKSYSTSQAFKVTSVTPPATPQGRWTGTCNVAGK
jgi:hypothetical protein